MSIRMYLGPMFSGKTSSMLGDIERLNIANIKTLVIKFAGDVRYSEKNEIITHGKKEYTSKNGPIISTTDLADVDKIIENQEIHAIGIDEFQFYKNPQYAIKWANSGIKIFISALDGDYKSDIFLNVAMIFPACDSIKKLHAVCEKCKQLNAIATRRTTEDKDVFIVGGKEMYIPLCRKCASWNI
jgi:thymidine kinase